MIDRTPAVEPPKRTPPRAFAALGHPQYRWLYASNQLFFLAMQAQQVVRSWIAFELTKSERMLGYESLAVALPMLLAAPLGGALGDRMERRGLILVGQGAILVSELCVLGLLLAGRLEFRHLLTLTFVMGCVFPVIMPARQAIVVNIVGKRGLANAMALSMAGINTTRILGPLVAGVLIGPLGIRATYSIGVAAYAVAWLLMLAVHPTRTQRAADRPSIASDIAEGIRYLRQQRLVLSLLVFGLVPMFLAMPFQTLLVVFAKKVWAWGPSGLGLLSGAAGAGGVLGSIYMAHHSERRNRLSLMLWSVGLFGAFLFLFALSPWFLLALPLVLCATVFSSIFATLNNAAIQVLIPDRVRSRISSFLLMSFSLPMLGVVPISEVAERRGAPFAVSMAALLACVAALGCYLGSPSLRSLDGSVEDAIRGEHEAEELSGREKGPLQPVLLK